jgi:peptidyl-prolyl cis-trans isomerase C
MSTLNDLPPASQAAVDNPSAAVNQNGKGPETATSQSPKSWLKRLVTEPLVHFLLIGAMIFGLHTYVERVVNPDDSYLIRVSPQLVNQVSTLWERQWRRPPTDDELKHLLEANVQEEVLYREALTMNLDKNDTIVRRWLVQKMDFLSRDMIPPLEPTDEEVQAYFEAHREDYTQPARVSFTHVFFDQDARGDETEPSAQTVLVSLNQSGIDRAPEQGDRFMLNYDYVSQEPLDVRQYFGKPFTDAVFELEPGQWQGPIESGYGLHLVRVTDRRDEQPAVLADVYDDVKRALMDERRQEANDAFYQALIDKYTIEVDDTILADRPELKDALKDGFDRETGALSNGASFNVMGY